MPKFVNRETMNRLFPEAAALLLLAATTATDVQAEYRCNPPRSAIDLRACAAASEGPAQLRRLVERTRMIYGLDFFDFANDATFAAWDAASRRAEGARSVPTRAAAAEDTRDQALPGISSSRRWPGPNWAPASAVATRPQ